MKFKDMNVDMDEQSNTRLEKNTGSRRGGTRICFVAPMIYPALDPNSPIKIIGGAEVQQICLGHAFADGGYSVHYVTRDCGQPDSSRLGEFVIHKTYRERSGIPGLRFFYPRVPSYWRALERADADIYYVRGAGYLVALVAHFAKTRARRAVFAVAHDANVDPRIRKLPTIRDKWLYRYGVHTIDAIVVQSNHQASLLRKNFGRRGHVIRNIWPQCPTVENKSARDLILWAAMYRDIKQPEHFVRLAASMPEFRFVMIGGPHRGYEEKYREIVRRSYEVKNLEIVGFKTLAETQTYFRRARALVNTSLHEGFPNTFVQAWAEGIPVVSYVDPDNLIRNHGLGQVARDEKDLPQALGSVLDACGQYCHRIQEYYRINHSPEEAVRRYARLFADLNVD